MKIQAKRNEDGSVDLYDINGEVFIQIHTAAEERANPKTDDQVAEIIRGCGWDVQWLERR